MALYEVIRKLILERTDIENEIIRQHSVFAEQITCFFTAQRYLQSILDKIAAGFGIASKK